MLNIYMKHILFLVFSLFYSGHCHAQSHYFKQYTVEDGLPSSEVYSAFQDSKGYMWFATDAGVSRFNGYEFENFDASDGLTDNTIFLITEDIKGRIWFGSFNCQLSYYKDGKIFPYEHNNVLKDTLNGVNIIWSFTIDTDMNIYIGFEHKGIIQINQKGDLIVLTNNDGNNINIIQKDRRTIFGGSVNANQAPVKFEYKNTNNGISFKQTLKQFDSNQSHISAVRGLNDQTFFQLRSNEIYSFDERDKTLIKLNIEDELASKLRLSLFYDDGLLYVCTHENGVYQCQIKADSLIILNHFFEGISIGRMYKDREGAFWFLSLKNGIYYCPSFLISNEYLSSNIIDVITTVTSNDGYLFIKHKNGLLKKNLVDGEVENLITNPSEYYIPLSYDKTLKKVATYQWQAVRYYKKKTHEELQLKKSYPAKLILSDSNKIYFANNSSFYALEDGLEVFRSNKQESHCTSLFKNGDKIWIGTSDGVKIYYQNKISTPFSSNKFLSSSVTSMERLDATHFLIGTKGFGVLIIENNDVIDIINEDDGLVGDLVRTLHVDDDKTIWVGTNKGLSRIIYQGINKHQVYNLTQKHGLESNEIVGLSSYRNKIYVTTSKGISFFDKTKIKINSISPPIYISKFKVNSKYKSLRKSYTLSYEKNFLQINFEGLSFRNSGDIEYQYRMLGIHSNWISTKSRSIQYQNLPPSEYTFQVRAKNEDGFWSVTPASISITIEPPFWLTWWFISVEIILGILFIYFIFRFRLKQVKSKNEINQKITEADKKAIELELTALRAQMNPHFIFNTLSTIRNAINTLDKNVASNYVVSFGKLIRMVLESSKKPKIELSTEIEMLKLYLDLEAMRFSEKFSYSISIDQEISEDLFYIPAMVIQPFVENAILHGLVPKEADNLTLNLSFSLKNNSEIHCTIEDNGIGREASEKLNTFKNLNKKSLGMQITKERLNLYYKETGKKYSFTIIDVVDEENKPLGTRAIIIFPL